MASWDDARIQREINGSFDAFEGQVYNDFRRDVHVVRPFRIPNHWERHIRIDHGLGILLRSFFSLLALRERFTAIMRFMSGNG